MSALSIIGSDTSPRGVLGVLVATAGNLVVVGCRPGDTFTAEVWTNTIASSVTDGGEYSITFSSDDLAEDTLVSVTASGTSNTDLATLLANACNEDARVGSIMEATVASNVITFTGRDGTAFSITETTDTGSKMTLANGTDAAAATTYDYGRAVSLAPATAADEAGFIASKLTAPTVASIDLTVTHGAGATYSFDLTYADQAGVTYAATVTASAGGDADATDTAIKAAVDALSWGNLTTTINATGDITISTFPGETVNGENFSGTGGGGSPDLTGAATAGTSMPKLGIVLQRGNAENDPATGVPRTATQAGQQFDALRKGGTVPVLYPGSDPTVGAVVFVEAAAGATNGRLYGSPSATRWLLPDATWALAQDPQDTNLSHVEIA